MDERMCEVFVNTYTVTRCKQIAKGGGGDSL